MFCENCGTQIPSNSQFCNACGAAQRPVPAPPAYYPPQAPVQGQPGYMPPQPPQGVYPPAQGVYTPPQGVYAQAQYGYAQPQMPAAGDRSGSAILARLPVVGGIAAALGFFLPWVSGGVASGWTLFIGVVSNDIESYGMMDVPQAIMMALLSLILVAGLLGLLTLIDSRNLRTAVVIVSLLALANNLALFGYLISENGMEIQELFSDLVGGWYLVLFGLLWMIFTPLFAPKPKPVYYNPYMPG